MLKTAFVCVFTFPQAYVEDLQSVCMKFYNTPDLYKLCF